MSARSRQIQISGFNAKRLSWLHFPPSNIIIKTSSFYKLRKAKELKFPYVRNNDRATAFGIHVRNLGETAWFVPGVSINIGPRKNIQADFELKPIMQYYDDNYDDLPQEGYFFVYRRNIFDLLYFIKHRKSIKKQLRGYA